MEARKLKRRNSRLRTVQSWEAYRTARNRKGKLIRRALLQGHREQVERAMQSPESMWRLAKWARNREGVTATTTPALKDPTTGTEYTKAQDKARLLKTTFLPSGHRRSRISGPDPFPRYYGEGGVSNHYLNASNESCRSRRHHKPNSPRSRYSNHPPSYENIQLEPTAWVLSGTLSTVNYCSSQKTRQG